MLIPTLAFCGPHATVKDVYYFKPISKLKITKGELPERFQPKEERTASLATPSSTLAAFAHARLDGQGEIYLVLDDSPDGDALPDEPYIAVRVPKRRAITGHLILPARKSETQQADRFRRYRQANTLVMVHFSLPKEEGRPFRRASFLRAKKAHYARLRNWNLPGSSWFHYQALAARRSPGEDVGSNAEGSDERPNPGPGTGSGFQRTFHLLSGGRAVTKNLQLDRAIPTDGPGDATVRLKELKGIKVQECNWKKSTRIIRPELDPLASHAPCVFRDFITLSFARNAAFRELTFTCPECDT